MRYKAIVLSICIFFLSITSSAKAYREIIDLGTLGGTQSMAYSINDSGQVVGLGSVTSNGGAFTSGACLFDTTGQSNNKILAPNNKKSCAYSINNSGQAVGDNDGQACLFDITNTANIKNLGSLYKLYSYDVGFSEAMCINNKNQIIGYAEYSSSVDYHACLFDSTGNKNNKDLGTLASFDGRSQAFSINDYGEIVGRAFYYGGRFNGNHACLFDSSGNGNNIDLGGFQTKDIIPRPMGINSAATSINDIGQIVGAAEITMESYSYNACLFDKTGGGNNINLRVIAGYMYSSANFINDNGQIVGSVYDSTGFDANYRACLFDPSGKGNNIDLNTYIDPSSGWILETATCINKDGWIVGTGIHNGLESRAFLLTPEPVTILLFGLSAIFLRRKK